MASVQKIISSASRDIDFNKLVLRQSNVRDSESGRLGLRLHHQTVQAPREKRAAGDRLTPVGLGPPFVSRSPALCHPDCRSFLTLIVGRLRRLFTFHIIAVSGEAVLHTDCLYVQVCQPATGHDSGILFRACKGRNDHVGGPNNFASLDLLNHPDELSRRIREACRA